jgi:aminoglycoside/choline kinase family phosphotransferase
MLEPSEILDNRQDLISDFLEKNNLCAAKRTPLAGDASFRRYERILHGGKSLILMDAPPPKENVRPFIKVAKFLSGNTFSAPKIIAEDSENGFLLLEDLGDDLYSRLLQENRDAAFEEEIYKQAAEALIRLHEIQPPADLPRYDEALLLREARLFTEWRLQPAPEKSAEYENILLKLFSHLKNEKPVVVLRDYHAENLIYLPGREAHKKVGLLDFQDAVIGSPAYDLVSLLEDARRDVGPELQKKIFAHFLALSPHIDREIFLNSYSLLGAQRNLKIIGIFTRLAKRDGKERYLSLLPRVWDHLANDLKNPYLAPLKNWLDETLK